MHGQHDPIQKRRHISNISRKRFFPRREIIPRAPLKIEFSEVVAPSVPLQNAKTLPTNKRCHRGEGEAAGGGGKAATPRR